MRRVRQAVLAAGWCAAIGVCAAQMSGPDTPSATEALKHGTALVWMVWPETAADKERAAARKLVEARALPTTVQQQTSGSFGQSSNTYGQTASSYGTASGSFGTAASDTGQTAGSYGTPSSNVGTNASDHGQTSSSYGQTAGSFGQTAGSYGQTSGSYQGTPNIFGQTANAPVRDPARDAFWRTMAGTYPNLYARYVDVNSDELQQKLAAAEGTKDYPDVLVAMTLPTWWTGSGVGLTMLGLPNYFAQRDDTKEAIDLRARVGTAIVLARAPHPELARAFVVWVRDWGMCQASCDQMPLKKPLEQPARVAADALHHVLQGEALGDDADVEMAQFNAELARRYALAPPLPQALDGLKYRIDVIDAAANERLAVVSLRAIASSLQAFGVVHSLVVLRRDGSGQWKVLQISPNVLATGWGWPREYTAEVAPEKLPHVVGISQAAPVDGDNRPPQPDLWWDNGGGASMLVVEWQMRIGGWTDSRMDLISDQANRTQTRIPAQFARTSGQYRWRVWSVGNGGVLKLSVWKQLNILP
jgi:hypothetical protein